MNDKDMIQDIPPKRKGLLSAILLTLVGIGLIFVIDSTFDEITCAPVVGVCVLFLLALKYPPQIVGICLIPLWVFVSSRLWNIYHLSSGKEELLRFWIRMLTFGTAGMLAVIASAYRSRLDQIAIQLLRVFESIPVPLLIVDHAGFIRSVSVATSVHSGLPKENLVGYRLTDVAGSHLLEEADENWYQHWLEIPEGKIFDAELQLGKHRGMAKVGRVGAGRHSIMIVIFL